MKQLYKKLEPSERIILGRTFACKLVEGFFILLAANALTSFIVLPTTENILEAFGFFTGRFILSGMMEKFLARLSKSVQLDFRKRIHAQLFKSDVASGELLTLTFDTIQALDAFFMKIAPQVASAIICLPLFLICAAVVDWLTAIILLVTLPIAPLLLWLIGKATADKSARALQELQRLNGEFRELLAAITTLKMFGRINAGATRLKATSRQSSATTLDVLKLAFVSSFALELITTLSIALVAVTLGLRLVAGSVEFQAALFLLIIAPEFFLPIRKFGVAFHVMMSARDALGRLRNFLRVEDVTGRVAQILMPPSITLDNVSFAYPKKNSPVLRNVSLKFSAGKVTALIGKSGSGKSTLLKLLAGLLKPTGGEILWNDLSTSRMERNSMLSKVSYAPQAPHLFDATLRKNFTMFDALDAAQLQRLLAALNLSTLDLNAPQKLSRGQLQRLGLIRALLKDTPIILLDEPTAGLDAATEQKVLALIKKIATRRTIIIATHRAAVIEFADEVKRI